MRNLKRVLSLALASIMLLGMMVVGASAADKKTAADLTDIDKVTNKDAVNLMVDLGIIVGKPDGTYAPTEGVDRATMAKLITYIMMGDVEQTAFQGTSTDLKDINTSWAEGYIKYCYSNGIITGDGKGNFFPTNGVTVVEASKMLLVALGYDAKAQGYTGNANWSTNIMKDAQKAGLIEDLGLKASDTLTRDAAAKMIFNALFANTVSNTYGYDLNGNKYVSGSVANKTTLGEETYNLQAVKGIVTGISANGKAIVDNVATELTAAPDQVGVNVVYYKNSSTGKLISSTLSNGKTTILGSSTDGAALADLGNVDKAAYIASADTQVTYYVNGTRVNATDTKVTTPVKGAIVDLIDNDNNGKYDVVRVTVKTVATVGDSGVTISKATSASKEDAVTVNGTALASIPASRIKGYEELVKGDVILYVKIGNTYYIETAETAEGQITGTRNTSSGTGYVLSGTPYYKSGLSNESAAVDPFASFNDFNKDIALYLDDNGTVVATKLLEEAAPAQYAVVAASAWVGGNGGLASSKYAEAQLVFTDGSADIVRISKVTKADGTVVNFKYAQGSMESDANVQAALNTYIYTYTVDSVTGAYALTEIKSPSSVKTINADGIIKRGVVNFAKDTSGNAIKGNNATIFLTANTKTDGTVTYNVRTGISEAPIYDGSTNHKATGHVLVNKAGFATIVYISNGDAASSATSKDLVYFVSTSYDKYPGTSTTPAYREYDAIVNGELTTVKVRDDVTETNPIAATLMEVTYADEYITTVKTETDSNSAAATAPGTVKASDGLVGFGNGSSVQYFTYTDDTKVFFIDKGAATEASVGDITTDTNDTVYYTVVAASKDSTQPLACVYITKVANEGGTSGDTATGYTVSDFNVVGGAGKATISAQLTGKSASDTGAVTIKYTPSRMLDNGTWVELGSTTVTSYTMNGTTAVPVSIDYNGTPGYLYKFAVEITFNNETSTFTSSAVEITAAPASTR